MKKVVFSSVFIILFGAYVFSQRLNPPELLPAMSPTQAQNTPSALITIPKMIFRDEEDEEEEEDEEDGERIPIRANPPLALPTPSVDPISGNVAASTNAVGQYKDGIYTGASADAYYGNIQVKAIIQGGRIRDVQFLDSPHTRTYSLEVNGLAKPLLAQEAIQAQSAQVSGVSGATFSSKAFIESLASALAQAKN